MKHFSKMVSVLLVIVLCLLAFPSCGQKEFTVYSCGSGFYFNENPDKNYRIKELDVTSNGNYFYLDDYFYSENLGTEYKIKGKLFTVGTVFLAKKSEHYNQQQYEFNLDTMTENIIEITSDMNYVKIFSYKPDVQREIYIHVKDRSLPIDLTLENVNLYTSSPIPVLFSDSLCDINLLLEGTNTLKAGDQVHTEETFLEYLKEQRYSNIEKTFYTTVREAQYLEGIGDEALLDIYEHFASGLIDASLDLAKQAFDVFENALLGKQGVSGINGMSTIMVAGGISIHGSGSLSATGGNGSNGGDAASSLLGTASGGNGGNGGAAIYSNNLLITESPAVNLYGGKAGHGGSGSKSGFGLFESSGNSGSAGTDGKGSNIANPREGIE